MSFCALVVSACSGNQIDDSLPINPDLVSTSTTADVVTEDDDAPEGLAFAESPQTLRVSVPKLDFIAPHLVDETDTVEVFVADLLTDGLTTYDPSTGTAGPGVASTWSTSADGLVWTFTLDGATFGDDTPVTADDVVASLNNVAALGIRSISGPNLWPIEGWLLSSDTATIDADVAVPGIVAVDDNTVEITLTEQFEPLAEVLAGVAFGIWPADVDEDAVNTSELPVSSSVDFTPTALWTDGVRLALADPVDGAVSTIEVFVDPTNSMLEAGETDMSLTFDPGDELAEGIRGVAVPRSADAYFAINSVLAPLDDVMIRQAIVHAIDREALRDEFFPDAGVMNAFSSPRSELGSFVCDDSCEFDIDQAQLLVEASPSRDIAFTVDYFATEGDDREQRLAEAVASQLRDVGLLATALGHSSDDFGGRAARGELGVFRFGAVSTIPSAEAELAMQFYTNGRDNLTDTSIERFDELVDEARASNDPSERAQIYRDAESVLFGEAVVLPLVEFRHHLMHGPTLSAAGLEPDGSLDLSVIEFAPDAE